MLWRRCSNVVATSETDVGTTSTTTLSQRCHNVAVLAAVFGTVLRPYKHKVLDRHISSTFLRDTQAFMRDTPYRSQFNYHELSLPSCLILKVFWNSSLSGLML